MRKESEKTPKGKNDTDHNTITIELDLKTRRSQKATTKWNITEETNWKLYNEILREKPEITTYNEWENRIKDALMRTAGMKTIKTDRKATISKESHRALRKRMKKAKKTFEGECRNNSQHKHETYKQLVKLNIELKTALVRDQREKN